MCDNCKEEDVIKLEEELGIVDSTKPETEAKSALEDVIMFQEPFSISTDNLENDDNIQIDNNEFIRGMKDASYFSGMYTCFINSGFSMEDAISIIMNKMNVDHNILMSQIQTNGSIEVSKNSVLVKEKDML